MTTFREYAFSIKIPKISKPKPMKIDWVDKRVSIIIGGSALVIITGCLAITNLWFLLSWVGLVPLLIYDRYCFKKESGELD